MLLKLPDSLCGFSLSSCQDISVVLLQVNSSNNQLCPGLEIFVQEEKNNDPVFANYWDQLQNDPDKLKVKDQTTGLKRLQEPGNFMLASEAVLTFLV